MIALAALALLAFVPSFSATPTISSLAISLLQYTVLATAWGMFSGPTRYVSLATAAFFGIGAYTVAVLGEVLPWPLVLLIAAALGAARRRRSSGCRRCGCRGVYFVIFTFGLAELVRQLVVLVRGQQVTRRSGAMSFVEITQRDIYWQLLAARRRWCSRSAG